MREQLVRDRRVVVVGGAKQIGKTSFLHRLALELPEGFVPVLIGLAGAPREDGGLEKCVAQAVTSEISRRLATPPGEPVWEGPARRADWFLAEFWPRIRAEIGERTAVILLDDIDRPGEGQDGGLDRLNVFLTRWRRQDHQLALVMTAGSARLQAIEKDYPALFVGAHVVTLGPLPNDDATRLITQPLEGRLTFDHGVPRRLVELASGHPYYLQLMCSAIFDRCAGEGWVNQHDVDNIVSDLAGREVPQFRSSWSESDAQERAVLAALASLRGARGVATAHEAQGLLLRAGVRVTHAQVLSVLEQLSAREILERLGALSYRFRVALFRDWLAGHLDLREAMLTSRWEAPGRRGRKARRGAAGPRPDQARSGKGRAVQEAGATRKAGPEGDAETGTEVSQQQDGGAKPGQPRARLRRWLLPAGLLCALLIVAATWILRQPAPPEITATPRAEVSIVRHPTGQPVTPTLSVIKPAPTATPTTKPTPTAPIVTSRSLPAIAYLSKPRDGGLWTVYLMGSDGSNRIPVTEASSDFVSAPSWSPRGDRLAFVSDRDGSPDIWVVDREGREAVNLTHDAAKDNCPAWSPDGKWIAFASVRDSPYWELYVMSANGTEVRRLTWWEGASDLWPSWSPDGSRLAFATKRDGNWEIYSALSDGSDLVRLTHDPADDQHPAWSPDGQWISFDSLRGGYADVYIVPAAGGDARNITRLGSASDLGPTWSPDGSRIAFYSDRNGDWDVFATALDGTGVVQLTAADTLDQLPAWRP